MKLRSICGPALRSPRASRIGGIVLVTTALVSLNALAFNSDLQPQQIEEAYSLGQTSNHEELAAFLKEYKHDYQYPPDHPDVFVQSIEFQTPYEQIVLRSQAGGARYERSQAEEAYRANPELVIVRAVFSLRVHYAGPIPSADSFEVRVSQSKSVEPRKMTSTVLCDPYSQITYPYSVNRDCQVYSRELLLQFDASQFAPGRTTIKVSLPNGQVLETKYNLEKLK